VDPLAFIAANTRLAPLALIPEIRLHLADAALPIWQKTEEQLGAAQIAPPYWAFAWAGGQALARYLLDNAHLAAGRRVLDLGAGGGLVAIAAKKAGAAHVLAADIDTLALAAITLNGMANGVEVATTGQDVLAAPPGGCNLVLVGDLFYERPLAERVLGFLQAAGQGGAEILVGDPERAYFPARHFDRIAEYAVPVSLELEDAESKRTGVWRLGAAARAAARAASHADVPSLARRTR
jgi:predicted nicotinamide N-methyase